MPENETSSDRSFSPAILVVEDDLNVRNFLEQFLSDTGYQVRVFSDGSPAIEYFTEHSDVIQLILTDVRLNDLTGMELEKKVHEIIPDFPIIAMSALANEQEFRKTYSDTFTAIITKPFSLSQFLYTIDSVLKNSQR